jgi:protease II
MAWTKKWTYPETKREDVEEEFFGVKVKDPYRWLEDADSPQTAVRFDSCDTSLIHVLHRNGSRSRTG